MTPDVTSFGPFLRLRSRLALAGGMAGLALLTATGAVAQIAADAGRTIPKAEIFKTQKVGAVLILTPELASPVLINPRGGSVETVGLAKVVRKADGSVDLMADAVLKNQGAFEVAGEDVKFTADGKQGVIKPRPPLLGLRRGVDLKAYNGNYAKGAGAYSPDAAVIATLRKQPREAVVRVYFGSWCPHCLQQVPKMLRVEQELGGGKLRFEYFGLPREISQDIEAKRVEIHSVPTGILYVAGREIGRIQGGQWDAPESALRDLLAEGGQGGT
jgi:thiol-disulfide isomerase/thioredoxin